MVVLQNENIKVFEPLKKFPTLPFTFYPSTFEVISLAADKYHFAALYKVEPNKVIGVNLVFECFVAEKCTYAAFFKL